MIDSLFIGNKYGGIINDITQVPQSYDAMVIIGLGGTGVEAISRLKTKLQKHIEPDNKEGVVQRGQEPRYEHIKFLGIDADKTDLTNSCLTREESFNIQNYNCPGVFAPMKLHALKERKDLQWMSVDYISQHYPSQPDGTGACRQFGRWLTISSANNIRNKIKDVINQVATGRNGHYLNIHIITGISGGMGGGAFVDVCYITKKVLHDLGLEAARVFGYFVLLDAVISKVGIIGNPVITASNEKNGIASLLEIEHLMNLKDSNEWFEQDYDDFKIKTQEKLVDMCHFVSATNMNGVLIKKGYEYALNVIGDYIIGTWYKKETSIVEEHIKFIPPKLDPEPERGYSQNYHIIGSANAEIPTTQMATYLATQLFKKLTIRTKMPDNIQIEQEFVDYLKLSDSRFKKLENQIAQGAEWNEITDELVHQLKNNVPPAVIINQVESSIRQRKGLLIQKRESMEKKVDSYTYEAGASSIPGFALNKLIEIVEDPTKGPIYAYGMMNKTGVDIFHYLDGRLKYYSSQKQHTRDQEAYFTNLEPVSKRKLVNSGFFSKGNNIKEYASILNSIFYCQAMADLYEQMEILMENLITAF
ncbi:tubulin-like doman-containing protein, partial [Catenibacterium mitsuokai]|uniref:tubulin-like doman-containing protein n=1 Tax=Catenibacterium mitsuokai TaxID=100886 RepID=UPI003D03AE25